MKAFISFLFIALCHASSLLSSASASLASLSSSSSPNVLFFDLDFAVQHESLLYEEQLLAFVLQGLVNDKSLPHPTLMFSAGFLNFDWPQSDLYWRDYFTQQQRVTFVNFTENTLCGLVQNGDPNKKIKGSIIYDPSLSGGNSREWVLPIAVTFASLESLLPVSVSMLSKFPCLAALPVVEDFRQVSWATNQTQAWEYAFTSLLPRCSKKIAFNLYHYSPQIETDPQSNATLANIDFAVQQKAFIMNFLTTGNPAPYVNPLFSRALANMEPLFSAYGWTDDEFGFVWMTTSSGASPNGTANSSAAGGGGAVFCSFATPNLSFWKLLALPSGVSRARPLPINDRGMKLDASKYYVLIETNEGDTPRIVVSLFSKSWTDPRRGSLPVSWAIDPVLAEEFPALFDYYASTATKNDSFISGPGGCGYVYYGRMTDAQIQTFATRCGRLMKDYGPAVIDTYGQTGSVSQTVSVLSNFSKYAAAAGVAPQMYISQPTGRNIFYSTFPCGGPNDTATDLWQPDGTPLVCSDHDVFYIPGSLGNPPCVSCELAKRINDIAAANKPPFFITVYGGLTWTATPSPPDREFWTLWNATINQLNPNIIPVGAQEMARLAREAHTMDEGLQQS